MSITITGAEFKAWLRGDWGHTDAYWDDFDVTINGRKEEDPDTDAIADTDAIVLKSGLVYLPNPQHLKRLRDGQAPTKFDDYDAISHFKAWRKQQGTATLVVTVPTEKVAELTAFLATIEGKVQA